MCGGSQTHGDVVCPRQVSSSLLHSDVVQYMVNPDWGFQNFVVSSMVSPLPSGQGDSPPELWTPHAGTLRGCPSPRSRQGREALGFTVPWRKCSGSCQPKANWKSPPTVFNRLIKAAADLIAIPNRSVLSFPRLLLSPLLAWLVAMI